MKTVPTLILIIGCLIFVLIKFSQHLRRYIALQIKIASRDAFEEHVGVPRFLNEHEIKEFLAEFVEFVVIRIRPTANKEVLEFQIKVPGPENKYKDTKMFLYEIPAGHDGQEIILQFNDYSSQSGSVYAEIDNTGSRDKIVMKFESNGQTKVIKLPI